MNTALQISLAGYLFFGQLVPGDQNRIVKHAGLQVIHADVLKDECQTLMVTRYVRT